ncbi:MAG: hypothetical protein J0M05_02010 [Candidatus Kapabacteria bacterium]|nr:hypothetical protein [Candidatus Kapabacteria bacterium]
MLDFYIINDDQEKPNYPEKLGLEFAGGLDNKTFDNLQNKGIIDRRFDYYSDFRLGTLLINQIRQTIIKKQLQADNDVKKITQLFDTASKKQSGLIAYGD